MGSMYIVNRVHKPKGEYANPFFDSCQWLSAEIRSLDGSKLYKAY